MARSGLVEAVADCPPIQDPSRGRPTLDRPRAPTRPPWAATGLLLKGPTSLARAWLRVARSDLSRAIARANLPGERVFAPARPGSERSRHLDLADIVSAPPGLARSARGTLTWRTSLSASSRTQTPREGACKISPACRRHVSRRHRSPRGSGGCRSLASCNGGHRWLGPSRWRRTSVAAWRERQGVMSGARNLAKGRPGPTPAAVPAKAPQPPLPRRRPHRNHLPRRDRLRPRHPAPPPRFSRARWMSDLTVPTLLSSIAGQRPRRPRQDRSPLWPLRLQPAPARGDGDAAQPGREPGRVT
jgi:hypothetical protein